ncbi:hypothetical protein VDG1235_2510 [Verrucomicrobiia bacterium DG1235]|nr:hypothetical protein VDG1235_2510 [Verrucomicrobiae bacterium DG1235]
MLKPHVALMIPRLSAIILALAIVSPLFSAKWEEIDPAEFSVTESSIDPEANVEYIFQNIGIVQYYIDWSMHTRYEFHFQLKVFDEVGVDEMTQYEIPLYDGMWVSELDARTVKPDGSFVEIDKDSIFDTEIERSSEGKVKAKGFAVPSLEPGDIVEVKVEVKSRSWQWYFPVSFNNEYPSRRTTLRLKPAEAEGGARFAHKIVWMNFPEATGKGRGGFFEFTRENEPAYADEPYRIPDFHTRPTVVMYYIFEDPPRAKDYWKEMGRREFVESRPAIKASKKVSDKAKELVAGSSSSEEKLRKLYDFCITEIRNRTYDFGDITNSERDEMKDNDNAGQTFDRGYGKPEEINALFAAMANAAGFEARIANVANDSSIIFSENLQFPFSLLDDIVAVKLGKEWKFYNPANPLLPFGYVNWWNSGSKALVSDLKRENFQMIPEVPASESVIKRTGDLTIDEQGALTGRVTQAYLGFEAVNLRLDLEEQNSEDSEKMIRDRVTAVLPRAKVSDIVFENARDPYKPMIVSYDLSVPEYAEVVGDRIFVQPAIFNHGKSALFQEESERVADVQFDYPWSELDELEITLPDGYVVESGKAVEPFAIDQVLSYDAKVKLNKSRPVMQFERSFSMERTMFPAKAADLFKKVFANVQVQDGYAVTFKKSDT